MSHLTYTNKTVTIPDWSYGDPETAVVIGWKQEPDPVNSPPHYQGGIECIDYLRQVLGEDGFRAYCLGNVIKYTHRHEYKGKPLEDLKKAQYYLNAAISTFGDK
jgi:Protein of unknwon function (DUF3310)